MMLLGRFAIYLGAALLLGGAAARQWRADGQPGWKWLWVGGGLILMGSSILVAVPLQALGFLTLADLPVYLEQTVPGQAVLTLLLGTTFLCLAPLTRWHSPVTIASAWTLLWGLGGLGHGPAHGPGIRLDHTVHAGVMSVWLGGVLTLVGSRERSLSLVMRFAPVATLCVLILSVTGMLATWDHMSGFPTTTTRYGQLLILKLSVMLLTLGTAGLIRRRLAAQQRVNALLFLELVLLGVILSITASLSPTPPSLPGGSAG